VEETVIGGKSRGNTRPDGLGTTLQSAVYGAAIPQIYGRTRAALEVIWAANFREQPGSGKKGKGKSKKGKSPPTYCENVDFLLGHNPIAGCLQAWANRDQKYPLNFQKYTTATLQGAIAIPDAQFYCILGVTATRSYSVTFNDYGGHGSHTFTGTYEVPLWNAWYTGPDPTNPSYIRYWPDVYAWKPASGATIYAYQGIQSASALNIYYAQLQTGSNTDSKNSGTNTRVPIAELRLTFEAELGNGTEYSVNPGQQILYPHYAGLGSPNIDMGTSGQIPNIRIETLGAFPLYSTGDADFADIIEDIFKSGITQAATGAISGYTDLQHGLSCYDLPGSVQRYYRDSLFWFAFIYGGPEGLSYYQANRAGNILIYAAQNNVSLGVTISSTAGEAWTPHMPLGTNHQVWTAPAVGGVSPNEVNLVWAAGPGFVRDFSEVALEIGGMDTVDAASSTAGTVGADGLITASITTTNEPGEPAYIAVFVMFPPGSLMTHTTSPHWSSIVAVASSGLAWAWADYRVVYNPGTYTIQYSNIFPSTTWNVTIIALKNSQPVSFPKPFGNILDSTTLDLCRAQCRANGLWGSLNMDSQRKAADWLADLYFAMDAAPVWSGFKLKSIPYSEVSVVGNGAQYTAPTAAGPVAILTESDFLGDSGTPPVTIERAAPRIDAPNVYQLQHPNRGSDYNDVITTQVEAATISLYGTRKESPKTVRCIQDVNIARPLANIAVRRKAYIEPFIYKFKLPARWGLLEPMDLVTIPISATMPTTPNQPPIGTIPLRLTSTSEDDQYNLDCEAEPFLYGVHAPLPLTVTAPVPYFPSLGADPGSVNTPVIFEPVPQLYNNQNEQQLWVVVSGANANYGGCDVMLSTDGGVSYLNVGALGNAITGVLAGAWPAAADPDTTNDLLLDLTESRGSLLSYQVSDEDNFLYPCYVQDGTSDIPYELMTYAVANLTSTYHYTLKATGGGTNKLRRAVYGAPTIGQGVLHALGKRFAFVGAGAAGVLKLTMDPTWIGKTLHFKFLAFNTLGGGLQSLASVTDYTYTPTGTTGGVNPNGIPPQLFTVNGN
jgi:hypothetical protein